MRVQTKWAFPIEFPVGYKPPKTNGRTYGMVGNEMRYRGIENTEGYTLPIPKNAANIEGNDFFLTLIRGGKVRIPKDRKDTFARMVRYRLSLNGIVKTVRTREDGAGRLDCWFEEKK